MEKTKRKRLKILVASTDKIKQIMGKRLICVQLQSRFIPIGVRG